MADNKIHFSIGSSFNGEGLKAARKEVGEINSNIKQATGAMGQMQGMLGSIDSSAAKATSAMTGMISALMTLNATTIITQGGMMALQLVVKSLNEEMARTKERAAELEDSVEASFGRTLAGNMESVAAEVKAIGSHFERITSQANAMTSALNGLDASVATGGVVALEIEHINAMLEAHSDAERETIDATYRLKIAEEKAAAVREQGAAKVEAAHTAVADSEGRVAMIDDQLARIREDIAVTEEALAQQRESNGGKQSELAAALNKLQAQENDLLERQAAEREKTQELLIREQTAIQDAENANAQATLAIKQVELAQLKSAEAAEKATSATESAASSAVALAKANAAQEFVAQQAEQERKDALQAEKDALQAEQDAQKSAADAAKALAEAERALAAALADYERQYTDNVLSSAVLSMSGGRMSRNMHVGSDVLGGIARHQTDAAVADGTLRNVREMELYEREQQRAAREVYNRRYRQLERERQRREDLGNTRESMWSESDRRFVERYDQLAAQTTAREEGLRASEAAVEEARQKSNRMADDVKDIKEKLERLGLK